MTAAPFFLRAAVARRVMATRVTLKMREKPKCVVSFRLLQSFWQVA
jgi:hypothetical protein